jgi:hypothetical protein
MGTLNLIERDSVIRPVTKPGFWRQQFAPQVTQSQIVFDIVFGVVGPILCFAFDPVVFRSGFMAIGPLFPDYQIYVYLLSGLQIVLLSVWLLSGTGFPSVNGPIGGALICGGIFCALVGCVLLPFSIFGLGIGIGVFGFTPFVTAIVYLRNGSRALHYQRTETPVGSRVFALSVGCLLALSVPVLLGLTIHNAIESSVDEIIHGDFRQASAAAHRLAPLKYFVGPESNKLIQAYSSESDPARKQFLKNCYQEITGEDIEYRMRIMQD